MLWKPKCLLYVLTHLRNLRTRLERVSHCISWLRNRGAVDFSTRPQSLHNDAGDCSLRHPHKLHSKIRTCNPAPGRHYIHKYLTIACTYVGRHTATRQNATNKRSHPSNLKERRNELKQIKEGLAAACDMACGRI